MINYYEILEEIPPDIRVPILKALENLRQEMLNAVTKSDFEALKNIVSDIALSQKELVEAQKETRKDIIRIDKTLLELADAQKRTEQRVEKLTEVMQDVNDRLSQLTDEVKILSKNVTVLTKSHINLKEMVGSLSHTFGYMLEDESYKALPILLKERMSIDVVDRLKRDYIEIAKDKYIEVNIIGKAKDANRKEYTIVGEAKTQLKRKDIDDFIKKAEELKRFLRGEQLRLLVTYQTSPQVQRYAKEKGVLIFFSYEF